VRILIAHVRYRRWGGEDRVVQIERRLLEEAGHEVRLVAPGPIAVRDYPGVLRSLARGRTAGDAGAIAMRAAIGDFSPEVVHVHNLFPLLGVGAVEAARDAGLPVVQTVHNYRYSCLAGTHFRDGGVCDLCAPCRYEAGVRYRCYRGSALQSRAMAAMLTDYWRSAVQGGGIATFIALAPFAAERLAGAGVEAARIVVKPNSVDASSSTRRWDSRSGVLFAGRLSPEKGIARLVRAWSEDLPTLTVGGGGPEEGAVARATLGNVLLLGHRSTEETRQLLRSARVLVLPSVWFEGGFPLVAMEALSEGTPVVAFDLGCMAGSLDARTGGALCPAGDFECLCATAAEIARADESRWTEVSDAAVGSWAREYSHGANRERLLSVYRGAR
jgi:glycosyltransferase involved in cell wall biosynthesis